MAIVDKAYLEETIAEGQGVIRTIEERLAQYREALALFKQAENLGVDFTPDQKDYRERLLQEIAEQEESLQSAKSGIAEIEYYLPRYTTRDEAIKTWFILKATGKIRHLEGDDYCYFELEDEIEFNKHYKGVFTLSDGVGEPEYELETGEWSIWFGLHPEYKVLIEQETKEQQAVKVKDTSTEQERLKIASDYRKLHPKAKIIYIPFTRKELENGVNGLDDKGIRNYLNTLRNGISIGLGLYALRNEK